MPALRRAAPIGSNTRMDTPDRLEQRLTALEIKACFVDDLVEQLNQIVTRQQDQIDRLQRELRDLRGQLPDDGAAPLRSLRDELPPHY